MRNAKLWSVLLVTVLLCALVIGVMFTGASASDSRIPTATTTYVVGTDADSIRACLELAEGETWGKDDVLEIQFSDKDNSIFSKPDAANGVSGYTMFEVPTIFRADDTKLPIVIRGTDENKAATIITPDNSYNATNDYYFVNLTISGGASGAPVSIYAGCAELVFENTFHNNIAYTYYYGDCQAMDSFIGWDAEKVEANVNEDGLLETGIIFGNGCTGLNTSDAKLPSSYNDMHLAAVGYMGDAASNSVIYNLRRAAKEVTEALSDEDVEEVRAAALEATFRAGNVIREDCILKPWDTSAYMILDCGKVATTASTLADYCYAGSRKGVSPVREARLEMLSGGAQYLAATAHNSSYNETYVGDTALILRGGRAGGYGDVGIRLTNLCMHVGDLTFEIHEDDANVPTYTPWIQPVANNSLATTRIYGNYNFLMTGGTVGDKKTGGANGYYGAAPATGSVVNEIRGGMIWNFCTVRYGGQFVENTPISTVLPGTGVTLTAKVAVHNKISGGTFGGVDANGAVLSNTGFYAGSYDSGDDNVPPSVCNEITGGVFYNYAASNRTYSNNFNSHIYNFVSGTTEKYPTFRCNFYGALSYKTTREVTNVIKGYPRFEMEDGTKNWIYGGCRLGTVNKVTNYLGGMPVFDDFYGGASGAAHTYDSDGKTIKAYNNAIVQNITNHIALDNTALRGDQYIWGGNGYYGASGENSRNSVTKSLVTNIYSGVYGTFRAESSSGTDACDIELNVYGGTWKDSFIPINRTYTQSNNTVKNYTVYTNIYGGTFNTNLYMAGQNARNQAIVNSIYGGEFSTQYTSDNGFAFYGGGSRYAGSIVNNIYGGNFKGRYYGGGTNVTANGVTSYFDTTSITNNIYGGSFGPWHDFMGASSTALNCTYPITNNFYGGDFGGNWTYGGGRSGSSGLITNNFYSGEENPVRDPENELYKYFDADGKTTLANGTYFRDQFLAGTGWDESTYSSNVATGIVNNLMGGCWTKEGGAYTYITFNGGMRWGIVDGNITNNVITGKYYRFFGGSNYGKVTGTVTNNFGKALAEGEQAPELTFYNFVGSSTSLGYIYGAGTDAVEFNKKITAAYAAANPSAAQKMYKSLVAEGEEYNCSYGAIVNNIYYGDYRQFNGGSLGLSTEGETVEIGSITNNVYGGTFTDTKVGNTTYHAYYGGCNKNAEIAGGITNNIYGGDFHSNYYGGTPGSGKVVCPTIQNNFYGGSGNPNGNKHFYLGNGAAKFTGTIHNVFYPAGDLGPGFDAKLSYVFGGCAGVHENTEADYAVVNEIRGGNFIGFWGVGGGTSTTFNANAKTVVSGGVFNIYDNNNLRNSIAGATRNGTTNGDILLEISGGTFNGCVVGGVIYGSNDAAADVLDGNVTVNITGGTFNDHIYGAVKEGNSVSLAEGKTETITITQTEGNPLKLGGKAHVDSFTANGEPVDITVSTDLVADAFSGTLTVNQTEGWKPRDYVKLPAGSALEVTEAVGAYGSYTKDDTVLLKGNAVAPAGTTIRLSERLGVRVLLTKEDVDQCGDQFSYKVTLEDAVVAEGTKADLEDYQGYYSFTFDGIGLADFDKEATISGPFFEGTIGFSIAGLAEAAKAAWAENYPAWADYAEAIVELNSVYNKGEANTKTPTEVEDICRGVKGENSDVASTDATVLMSDAAGLRLNVVFNNAPVGAKVFVGDQEIPAEQITVEGTNLTAEFFFSHEYLAETFVIRVVTDAGEQMSYTASIESLVGKLAIDDKNEQKNNAIAFLYYIQKAVACK